MRRGSSIPGANSSLHPSSRRGADGLPICEEGPEGCCVATRQSRPTHMPLAPWVSPATPGLSWATGPLPSITGDPAGFADLVDKRLAELMQRVQAVDHRLSDQLAAMRERDLRGLRDRLAHVEETTRGVAIGGLREQVFGWALVVLGFTIQGIAQFIQPS